MNRLSLVTLQPTGMGFFGLYGSNGAGAPCLIDLDPGFPLASTRNVLTLSILAAPNSDEVGIRMVEEVSWAVAEMTISTDLLAPTQLLGPRNYLNDDSTAAVSYGCSGVYVETDF